VAAQSREATTIMEVLNYDRRRPIGLCGLSEVVALPVIFALWMHGATWAHSMPSLGGIAARAALLALAAYGLFRAALLLMLNFLAPDRLTFFGGVSVLFYEFLVLAYTIAFIPTAVLAFVIVRRLGLACERPPRPRAR
jgi:hypothetical protein